MNEDLKSRVHRIGGQVSGIERMIVEDRDCLEVLQQIVASREALGSLGKEILKNEALCLREEDRKDPKRMEKILISLFKME